VTISLEQIILQREKEQLRYIHPRTLYVRLGLGLGQSCRGVQDAEYRSRLRQDLAFFNRSRSRTRSGYFRL